VSSSRRSQTGLSPGVSEKGTPSQKGSCKTIPQTRAGVEAVHLSVHAQSFKKLYLDQRGFLQDLVLPTNELSGRRPSTPWAHSAARDTSEDPRSQAGCSREILPSFLPSTASDQHVLDCHLSS
jgi:hypothetical protein